MKKQIDPLRQLELDAAVSRARTLRADGKVGEAAQLAAAVAQAEPRHVGALRLMGALAMQTGTFDIAIGCFSQALAAGPRSLDTLLELGDALLAGDRPAEAANAFRKALELRPRDGTAFRGLAKAQLDMGQPTDALKSFRKALSILSYDGYSAHMVAALSGEPQAAADGYVSQLFDDYAGYFDEHLTGTLQYRIPQRIHDMIASHTGIAGKTLLDLGCGTGLVGVQMQGLVAHIDGIDISRQMILKAEERNVYRHLRTGDMVDGLARDPALAGPYDLVIGADVFIYMADLAPVFTAVSQRLAATGLFAFSVESTNAAEPQIRSSGRFAHPQPYIERLADTHDFTIVEQQPTPIRQERNQPIAGMIYLLRPGQR